MSEQRDNVPTFNELVESLRTLNHSNIEHGVHVQIANELENKYAQLEAENEALREYALGLMVNSYHGMGEEERKLILESELIALLTAEVLDGS